MSITAIRDAFNYVSEPEGIRCVRARLHYCDAAGGSTGLRNHSRLEFDLAQGDRQWTIKSGVLVPGASAYQVARALARQAIEAPPVKDEPPDAT